MRDDVNGNRRRELETQLSAYLDDELRPEERREVEALLAADEGARVLLERLRATVDAVRGLPRARASDRLIESLRSRLERQSLLESPRPPVRAGGNGHGWLRWIAAAAVIALVVTGGYLAWPWIQQREIGTTRHFALNDRQPTERFPSESLQSLKKERFETEPAGERPVLGARSRLTGEAGPTGGMTNGLAGTENGRADVTVVELTVADARSRRAVVQRLREEYAFQPVAPGRAARAVGDQLEIRVPDAESARRVIHSLKASLEFGEKLQVINGVIPPAEPAATGLADSLDMRRDEGERMAQPLQAAPVRAPEAKTTYGYHEQSDELSAAAVEPKVSAESQDADLQASGRLWRRGGVDGFSGDVVGGRGGLAAEPGNRAEPAMRTDSAPAAMAARRQLEHDRVSKPLARPLAQLDTRPAETPPADRVPADTTATWPADRGDDENARSPSLHVSAPRPEPHVIRVYIHIGQSAAIQPTRPVSEQETPDQPNTAPF